MLYKKQKTRPWIFMLIENKNDQGDIIFHIILQVAANSKSAYKEISLIMQTTIQALQKVNPLAIYW